MIPFPRFYLPLALLLGCVIPTVLPVSLWNECLSTSLFVAFACRFAITSNITFMTNSVSHTSFDALCWGSKPYDKWDLDIFSKKLTIYSNLCSLSRTIGSVENSVVAALTIGEGWHNYHHVFPWDYKAAELGNNSINLTTNLIDCFASIGWVSDRKSVTENMIRNRAQRTGDGSHVHQLAS